MIEGLFGTPDWHLFAFEGDQALFVRMDREAYRRSIFLDRRIQPAADAVQRVPVAALAEAPGPAPGWIFHIAHCGSTLLARALDLPARSLVLREPLALRQLAVDPALAPAERLARLRLAAACYGRRYDAAAPAIVKANVPVNFIARDILPLDPAAPALFLYFPLRLYLLAILRSEGHRTWLGNVTTQLAPAIAALVGDMPGAGLAERAAALWLAQMHIYAGAIAGSEQARSLDAETLFTSPRSAVEAATAHFGIDANAAELDEIAASELFTTYSKDPGQPFDNAARLALQAETERGLGPELDRARRWLESRLARNPLPATLGRPITGSAPALLT